MSEAPPTGNRVLGFILVVVGLVFLLVQLVDVDMGSLWPLFVLLPGLAILFSGLSTAHESGVIGGSVITAVGLVLTYQNLTDHWESWSYAWALVGPGAVGTGRWLWGVRSDDPQTRRSGARLASSGAALFLVGLLVFEGVIGVSGRDLGPISDYIIPGLLVLAGLWLVFRPGNRHVEETSEPPVNQDDLHI